MNSKDYPHATTNYPNALSPADDQANTHARAKCYANAFSHANDYSLSLCLSVSLSLCLSVSLSLCLFVPLVLCLSISRAHLTHQQLYFPSSPPPQINICAAVEDLGMFKICPTSTFILDCQLYKKVGPCKASFRKYLFDVKTERQKDRKTERQKDRQTERQKDRNTETQKHRKTVRQKDRETERWKQRKKDIETVMEYIVFLCIRLPVAQRSWPLQSFNESIFF